jgi:hypothetical protein
VRRGRVTKIAFPTILPEGASFIASGNSAMLEIPSGSNPEGLKRGDIPVAFRN